MAQPSLPVRPYHIHHPNIIADLTSVDAQYLNTERPPEIDLPENASGFTLDPPPISSASYDSKQDALTPYPFLAQRASSDVGIRPPGNIPFTGARSVQSDSNVYTNSRALVPPTYPGGFNSLNVRLHKVICDGTINLIEKLRDFVAESHTKSMASATLPDIILDRLALNGHEVFDTGLRALGNYFGSSPLSTLKELYCFLQIILGFVHMNYRSEVYDWRALVQGFSKLGSPIRDDKEQAVYQNILKHIFRTPNIPSKGIWVPGRAISFDHAQCMAISEYGDYSLDPGKGKVMSEAKGLVDRFDSLRLEENGFSDLPPWGTQQLIGAAQLIVHWVFKPLQHHVYIGEMEEHTLMVQTAREQSKLFGPREAEIMLRSLCTASTGHLHDQNRIKECIASCFDETFQDSNWRDSDYRIYGNRMIDFATKVNNSQNVASKSYGPPSDQLSSSHSELSKLSSRTSRGRGSLRSIHRGQICDLEQLPPSVRTSLLPHGGSSADAFEEIVRRGECPLCNRKFKPGKHQRRSFKRHFDKNRLTKPFRCAICDRGYTTKDSLKRHVKDDHANQGAPQS